MFLPRRFGGQKQSRSEKIFPHIEPLESRRLLSASVVAGVLKVVGTSGDDTIVISRAQNNSGQIVVTENGQSRAFDARGIRFIKVSANDGNDTISVDERNGAINKRTRLVGGNGNDRIVGGSMHEELFAGRGNDTVFGNGGDDTITGHRGADELHGGDGNDFIFGDNDSDTIFGDNGNDQLYGGDGDDSVRGNAGNDTMGGDGEDRLVFLNKRAPRFMQGNDILGGDAGADWILGGGETDTLSPLDDVNGDDGDGTDDFRHAPGNGRDTLHGGKGPDILDARGGDDVVMDKDALDLVPAEDYTNGGGDYAVHHHIFFRVFVRGNQLEMPVGFGNFGSPVIHSHIESGLDRIHLHSIEPHTFTVREIFQSLGVSMDDNHIGTYRTDRQHRLTMTVNGVANTELGDYEIKDEDVIELHYT